MGLLFVMLSLAPRKSFKDLTLGLSQAFAHIFPQSPAALGNTNDLNNCPIDRRWAVGQRSGSLEAIVKIFSQLQSKQINK